MKSCSLLYKVLKFQLVGLKEHYKILSPCGNSLVESRSQHDLPKTLDLLPVTMPKASSKSCVHHCVGPPVAFIRGIKPDITVLSKPL